MKVIFIQDVQNVAKAGDTKEVAEGYGRNYLLPKKLAVLANSNAKNVLERQRKVQMAKDKEQKSLADSVNGKEITVKVKVGAENKMYGSVTSADIVAAVKAAYNIEIDKHKVELPEPIKQVGTVDVPLKIAKDTETKIKVNVVPEEVNEGESRETPAA